MNNFQICVALISKLFKSGCLVCMDATCFAKLNLAGVRFSGSTSTSVDIVKLHFRHMAMSRYFFFGDSILDSFIINLVSLP